MVILLFAKHIYKSLFANTSLLLLFFLLDETPLLSKMRIAIGSPLTKWLATLKSNEAAKEQSADAQV